MKHEVRPIAQRLVSLMENDEETFRILHEALTDLKKKTEKYTSPKGMENFWKPTIKKIEHISKTVHYLMLSINNAKRGIDSTNLLTKLMKEDYLKTIN